MADLQEGLRHGQGKAVFANQDCYQGDFLDGQVNFLSFSRRFAEIEDLQRKSPACVSPPQTIVSAAFIAQIQFLAQLLYRSKRSPVRILETYTHARNTDKACIRGWMGRYSGGNSSTANPTASASNPGQTASGPTHAHT